MMWLSEDVHLEKAWEKTSWEQEQAVVSKRDKKVEQGCLSLWSGED